MGKGGRKPKPTHLKLLEGNRKKEKLNKREPKPDGDLLEPPDFLTKEQKIGWAYAIAHSPRGLLKKLDRSALVSYIVAEDLYRQAVVAVNKSGLVVKSPVKEEPMQNPYLAIVNKQAQIMLRAQAELGFTPSARSRISIGDLPPGDGEDSFDDL